MELNINLHEKQMQVFRSEARFRVVAAGRRFGKTFLSCCELLIQGLESKTFEDGRTNMLHETWYVAPTYGQAKDIMWQMLLEMGRKVIKQAWSNSLTVQLINGRFIKLKGSDKPDSLRGSALGFVVLDEYASMRPEVFDLIIRPALADTGGGALFIGTPDGLNHFYEVHKMGENPKFTSWESFTFNTIDNPIINESELREAALTMTEAAFEQEFQASFSAAGGGDLDISNLIYLPESPEVGTTYMTVDPNGFDDGAMLTKSRLNKLDETSIAVCEVSPAGWFFKDIIHGRWNIRETSLRIVRAAQVHRPSKVGIEKGALKNAIMPYISDQQKRLNTFFRIEPLSHGGKAKTERIVWSLQGRMENSRIMLRKDAKWIPAVKQQMNDFPNKLAHDDIIDSMSYVDQLGGAAYNLDDFILDEEDWDVI